MPPPSIDTSRTRIAIVGSDAAARTDLEATLRDLGYAPPIHFEGRASDSGLEPDLFLLDFEATETAARDLILARHPGVPVLAILCDTGLEGRARAAASGVSDFLLAPVEPAELQLRILGQLGAFRTRRLLADRSSRLTEALRDRAAELDTVRESLSVLAAVADYHDDDTDHHAQRVGTLSAAIASALGLPVAWTQMLGAAAPLHDIGKVGISRRILLKPGSLTPPERLHMMQHVDIGGQILASAGSSVLVLAAEIARTHHERWDGTGYTAGLSGEEIPLSGRIVAVADVWDTLTHDRPYRLAWSPERAMDEIQSQADRHFDPQVVAAFLDLDVARPTLEPSAPAA